MFVVCCMLCVVCGLLFDRLLGCLCVACLLFVVWGVLLDGRRCLTIVVRCLTFAG